MILECYTYLINKENSINVKDMFYQFEIAILTALNRKKNPEKSNLFAHTAPRLLSDQLYKAAQFCMVNGSTFKIKNTLYHFIKCIIFVADK